MPAIGVTRGISTGKSTICDCLRKIVPTPRNLLTPIKSRTNWPSRFFRLVLGRIFGWRRVHDSAFIGLLRGKQAD
jgi:hypothetical protein